jgi:hypothetical protein
MSLMRCGNKLVAMSFLISTHVYLNSIKANLENKIYEASDPNGVDKWFIYFTELNSSLQGIIHYYYFFLSIKRIMRTTLFISVTLLCEDIWPGADGLIRIFTFPHLVIIYCKETAQTRKGRAMQRASTKSQITTPEPGIEPGSM